VVLARVLDDSTFNVINSCILFNQMDIINHVQHDRFFLAYVVQPFLEEGVAGVRWWRERLKEFDDTRARSDEAMDVDGPPLQILPSATGDAEPKAELQASRRSVVLMLQQLCAMGKNVQLPTRLNFFRSLIDRAILFPVQWSFTQDENDEQGKQTIAAAGETLSILLDHDINGVRGFVLRQLAEADGAQSSTLLLLMCKNMVRSRDLAVQSQMGDALRLMLEIPLNDPNDPTSQVCRGLALVLRVSHRFNRHRLL
jgi:protein phosphatase-4 regulatory subunit 3